MFLHRLLQVCQWVFGQEFPEPDSPLAQQVFAVVTAVMGLCAFALVLALVEQVVLEGMEANVKRGSVVYETDHVSKASSKSRMRLMVSQAYLLVVSLPPAADESVTNCFCSNLHLGVQSELGVLSTVNNCSLLRAH